MQEKQTLKRNRRLGLSLDGLSATTRSSSPVVSTETKLPVNQGGWPAPPLRASGPPGALVSTTAPLSYASPAEPSKRAETVPIASAEISATPFKPVFWSKGTMENLPVQPLPRRPHTPAQSVAFEASESPEKPPTPVWARSLAHRIETSPPAFTQPPPAQALGPATPVSRPPHLRKKLDTSTYSVTSNNATVRSSSDSFDGINTPVQPSNLSAAPSLDLPRHKQTTSDAVRLKSNTSVKDLRAQKSLLESFIPKSFTSSLYSHERYLQIKLINLMEEEMDVSSRTTRRQLANMSEREFQARLTETKTMHELTWAIKHKRGGAGEMDMEASLAFFQQEEKKQFNRFNDAAEAK